MTSSTFALGSGARPPEDRGGRADEPGGGLGEAPAKPLADPWDNGHVDDASLTLLERLDRRQNTVLMELDRLNDSIEQLVAHCQGVRQQLHSAS